jgi:hypothetical protein
MNLNQTSGANQRQAQKLEVRVLPVHDFSAT